jgi:CheY-like chemotaxis protein
VDPDSIYSQAHLPKPMVLLVDDNEIQLTTRRSVLARAGFNVSPASSAAQALELVRDEASGRHLRLAITDHVMPGMMGHEFVRQLRTTLPELPVLVISGQPDIENDYADLNVGFLPKPCAPELLIERVSELLQTPLTRTA